MMKIGMIGTGTIAPAYMRGLALFEDDVQVVACADLNIERAQAFATDYHLRALSVDDLLADNEVDIVLNLTIPIAHAEVALKTIAAGKHAYAEKPLAIKGADGKKILAAAKAASMRVACAPDTFLGAGGQTARHLIESGAIGRPIAATAFMLSRGPEPWHPNPFFYYQAGGGPMLDMGPYYLTALVNLLGSMRRVAALTARGVTDRVAGHEGVKGQAVPVEVQTHYSGSIEFASGAIATVITSFDIWKHNLPRIEIHGTEGSLSVPDPNTFAGAVRLWQPSSNEWTEIEHTHRSDVQRGIGLVDMARCIEEGKEARASGALAYHVLDAMLAFETSSERGQTIVLDEMDVQPSPLPQNI
ncbi:MAG: Gfo/Idh/MocA family oxidoreductase [Anaerolineae bacterium]|nr:Gfo/Idh/MocA family oxidoreductase [Anaerolineae bacterium]